MKKQGVELHKVYAAKVSGKVVPVRLDSTNPHGGWNCTNMVTRKPCRVATAQRLRGLWPKKNLPIVAEKAQGKADDKGVAETVAAVEKGNLAEGVTVPESKRGGNQKSQTTSKARPASLTAAQTTRPSLLNLAAIALAEAGTPLNCKEMIEKVLSTGLWKTSGKTPAATLYSAILREITTKGDASRFRKSERGKFEIVTK